MCIPCQGHHWYLWEPTWIPVGSRKVPGYNGQVCTWMCMCDSVCGYDGVPIFCGIGIYIYIYIYITTANLYDYTCVVILKKNIYYNNKYHIRGPETSWFLAPFSMGEGLLIGLRNVWCKKRSVFIFILSNYILASVLITTTNHITTRNSYRYPRARCLFSLQVPSSARKGTLVTSEI